MPGMKKHDILGHEFMGMGEPWGCAQPARAWPGGATAAVGQPRSGSRLCCHAAGRIACARCPAQPCSAPTALPCPALPAVEEVGPEVKEVRKGDRVVVAFDIACGTCFYCRNSYYTSCVSAGLAPAAPDPGCAPAWPAPRGEGHMHGV